MAHEPPMARFGGIQIWRDFDRAQVCPRSRASDGMDNDRRYEESNIYRKQSDEHYTDSKDASDFLVKPVTVNRCKMPAGFRADQEKQSQSVYDRWKNVAREKAILRADGSRSGENLGWEMVPSPGHHDSFFSMPHEWAATLRSVLHFYTGWHKWKP